MRTPWAPLFEYTSSFTCSYRLLKRPTADAFGHRDASEVRQVRVARNALVDRIWRFVPILEGGVDFTQQLIEIDAVVFELSCRGQDQALIDDVPVEFVLRKQRVHDGGDGQRCDPLVELDVGVELVKRDLRQASSGQGKFGPGAEVRLVQVF